jgi:hypothetical protein
MEALKAEIARKRKALEDSKLMVRLFHACNLWHYDELAIYL